VNAGLWEWRPAHADSGFVVPGWYARLVRQHAEEGVAGAEEIWRDLRPVPDPPYLFEYPAPLPPECDFHAELHDLVFPVPDPPPPGLVERVRDRVRRALG
jgi:hypothetical protein